MVGAICLLCATSAFSQTASVLTGTAQQLQLPEHPQHAEQHSLARESSLLEFSSYAYAKGEVPLSEFAFPIHRPIPLGDLARAARKDHVNDRKAAKVTEN